MLVTPSLFLAGLIVGCVSSKVAAGIAVVVVLYWLFRTHVPEDLPSVALLAYALGAGISSFFPLYGGILAAVLAFFIGMRKEQYDTEAKRLRERQELLGGR